MFDLLKELKQKGKPVTFLFPGLGDAPVSGKVEDVTDSRVTIIATVDGGQVRLVTHPNSVVAIERLG